MSDAPHWTDIVLAIIAVIAAIIATIACYYSKKSAKIDQADSLRVDFDKIGCLLDCIKGQRGWASNKERIVTESIEHLTYSLAGDRELQSILSRLPNMIEARRNGVGFFTYDNEIANIVVPSEYIDLINAFERKKREYLSIG